MAGERPPSRVDGRPPSPAGDRRAEPASVTPLGREDAERLQACIAGGGVAVFPTDTVYGLCCDPENENAVRRLYELKGRPAERPAAVMFFALESALRALPELAVAERAALQALLPGPVTLLLPNPAGRFVLACGPGAGGRDSLGLRVPLLPDRLVALGSVSAPVMQSSANISGEADPRRLADVPARLLDGADLVLDGGELAGTPSTVVDLRDFQARREWRIVREGAASQQAVAHAFASAAG
jgi:L-threonylcarbamoyladenylate synthase